jgi:hypothetical protein
VGFEAAGGADALQLVGEARARDNRAGSR